MKKVTYVNKCKSFNIIRQVENLRGKSEKSREKKLKKEGGSKELISFRGDICRLLIVFREKNWKVSTPLSFVSRKATGREEG